MEPLFDQRLFPCVVWGLEVLQVFAAIDIDVDELELITLRRVALPGESLVEHQVVWIVHGKNQFAILRK